MERPEQEARKAIDAALTAAGWEIQDPGKANVHAARGVAIREFPLKTGHGFADHLLYVDGKAAGVIEAKRVITTLTASRARPGSIPTACLATSPGLGTLPRFSTRAPASRHGSRIASPPSRGAVRSSASTVRKRWPNGWSVPNFLPAIRWPTNLRALIQHLPELASKGLWDVQSRAVLNLERSLRENRPRAFIQIATGSGKAFTAIPSAYRLIKFGSARRVSSSWAGVLGHQALKEFCVEVFSSKQLHLVGV